MTDEQTIALRAALDSLVMHYEATDIVSALSSVLSARANRVAQKFGLYELASELHRMADDLDEQETRLANADASQEERSHYDV
jgi:hypothetical protein